jgi:hypothetical protein
VKVERTESVREAAYDETEISVQLLVPAQRPTVFPWSEKNAVADESGHFYLASNTLRNWGDLQ